MRRKRLKPGILLLFGLGLTLSVQAQEVIPASGGNASGSGGTVSYTIGQVLYTTSTCTNGFLAEGVQQPYEISVVVGIEQAKDINLLCTAYPNPFNMNNTISYDIPHPAHVATTINDSWGKQVRQIVVGPKPAGHHIISWDPGKDVG